MLLHRENSQQILNRKHKLNKNRLVIVFAIKENDQIIKERAESEE
jgi:hypothetical protein